LLGLKEMGLVSDISKLQSKTTKEILPQSFNREVYHRNFEAYRKVYNCTKELMI
jgi:hypothetical protein